MDTESLIRAATLFCIFAVVAFGFAFVGWLLHL
jgi:hypothetical protein